MKKNLVFSTRLKLIYQERIQSVLSDTQALQNLLREESSKHSCSRVALLSSLALSPEELELYYNDEEELPR